MRRITAFCLALALLLLGLTGLAAAQNVTITLTPQGTPIQLPAQGGSFSYVIAATNNGAAPQQVTVWCMLTLPNGNPWGPALGPVTVTLGAGQTLERLRTQNIPAYAPAGNYIFTANIGVYPNTIWDSDSFPFEKLSSQPGGTELWVARYNGPENGNDNARALAVDRDGNVYVTGNSRNGPTTDGDFATIKYDVSGNTIWVARYAGPYISDDEPYALALDAGGNVYVTGENGEAPFGDFATIKYNPSGNQIWEAHYNGPGNGHDAAYSLAVDNFGYVYVTGESINSGSWYLSDYTTIKYDSLGNQVWVAQYNGPGNWEDGSYALALDLAGNVYVTGYSSGAGTNLDYATIKYDTDGNQIWVARYNGTANYRDLAYALAVDDSGNAYVTGMSADVGSSYDYATVKYDAEGNQIWVALYGGPGNWYDEAHSIVVSDDGNIFVTGWSAESVEYPYNYDYATIKYDPSGNQVWAMRYDGTGGQEDYDDKATSLAVDSEGNAYVTGWSYRSATYEDYATIKYNSAGAEQWIALYNGPANYSDLASYLTLNSSGDVFVTGFSVGRGSGSDYATIKYSGGNVDNWMPVEATVFGRALPQECRLEQNYPNPFNAATVISYQLSANSYVNLRVYDTAGRLVETLVDGWRSAGTHELTFDASNLPSGVYFARLEAGDYVGVQKMILLK